MKISEKYFFCVVCSQPATGLTFLLFPINAISSVKCMLALAKINWISQKNIHIEYKYYM